MDIHCKNCGETIELDENYVLQSGKVLKCKQCNSEFKIDLEINHIDSNIKLNLKENKMSVETREIDCGKQPPSTMAKIITTSIIIVLIAMCILILSRPHPLYRIKWNEMTSTAIIEKYDNIGNGHLGWKRARYLGNFSNLKDANEQLDKIMETVNKDRAEEASWKVIRVER